MCSAKSQEKKGTGKIATLTPEAEEVLCKYTFPGNVRELENILERAVALSDEASITATDLNLDVNDNHLAEGAMHPDATHDIDWRFFRAAEHHRRSGKSALEPKSGCGHARYDVSPASLSNSAVRYRYRHGQHRYLSCFKLMRHR